MDFFIDLNKIKEAKSRKVFSLSGHIQKNSNDGPINPTNPTNLTWIGSKIKNTFRDFATFTGPKFKWWWLRYIFAVSTHHLLTYLKPVLSGTCDIKSEFAK